MLLSAAFVDCTCLSRPSFRLSEQLKPFGVRLDLMFGMDISMRLFTFLERLGSYLRWGWGLIRELAWFWATIFLIVFLIWSLLRERWAVGEFSVLDLLREWKDLFWAVLSPGAGDNLLFFLLSEYIDLQYYYSYSSNDNQIPKLFSTPPPTSPVLLPRADARPELLPAILLGSDYNILSNMVEVESFSVEAVIFVTILLVYILTSHLIEIRQVLALICRCRICMSPQWPSSWGF